MVLGRGRHPKGEATGIGIGGGAPDSGKTPFVCFPAESVSVGAGFAPFFAPSALDSSPSVHCRFLSVPYPRQRTPFVHSASSQPSL